MGNYARKDEGTRNLSERFGSVSLSRELWCEHTYVLGILIVYFGSGLLFVIQTRNYAFLGDQF